MKVIALLITIFIPYSIYAQEINKGISFESGTSWKQIQEKAKRENKLIFMDCNTTWCGPCKEMDRTIFTQEKVGAYFNGKFISVKVQMDSSNNDNEDIKGWYKDANYISQHNKITAYPTLFFFSANGDLVHKAVGFQDADVLLSKAEEATNPDKQYFTLLKQYSEGKLPIKNMAFFASTAKLLGDNEIAQKAATRYTEYLKRENIFTKDNIDFLMSFVQSSNDNSFKVLYKNRLKVDSVIGIQNYLQGMIDFIIAKEEIDPIIFSKTNPSGFKPDWDKIIMTISKKYNTDYANRTVTGAKIRWSAWKQDWPEHTKNLVIFVEKYDTDKSAFNLNNKAWAIFEHSSKIDELNAALKWSNYSLKLEPAAANWMDTNANILYKLGKNKEAISVEEKAVKLEPENQEFKINLEKMKNGVSTWQ